MKKKKKKRNFTWRLRGDFKEFVAIQKKLQMFLTKSKPESKELIPVPIHSG